MRIERDPGIDFIRGVGILMIGIDHLTYLAAKVAPQEFINPFITWLKFGWSSAAEFFVFFSGFLTGIVYTKTMRTHGVGMMWARAAQRSWHIYVLNLLTLCAVLLFLNSPLLFDALVNRVTRVEGLTGPQAGANLLAFLGMRFEPLFFEILNLYIALLLLAPVVVLLSRISAWLPLLISCAVWLLVQISEAYALMPALTAAGNFNPFAWQLMFVLGMLAGIHDLFGRLRAVWSRQLLLRVSGALLLGALLLKVLDYADFPFAFAMVGYDKPNLGPLQVVHFLVSVVFVMQILPPARELQSDLPARAVCSVGRRSLECFCLSTILAYVAVAVLARYGSFDPLSVYVAGVAVVLLLCVAAPVIAWIGGKPWNRPAPAGTREESHREEPAAVARGVP